MALISNLIDQNNDSRQLRRRYIYIFDFSQIQIISIEDKSNFETFRRNEKSWTTHGSQTRQPNLRIKQIRLDFTFRTTYDMPYTNIHGHEYPHLFLFLHLSQHRNSRAAIVVLKKTS